MNKLSKLEALRGFAALYVVLHHIFSKSFKIAGIDLSLLFKFGQEAVILFFILSGFVIQYAYEKAKDKSFKLYFFKRSLRIYIPLIIVFITNYIVKVIDQGSLLHINWYHLLGNILMLQDVSSLKLNVICPPFLGNTPLWSLSYEWWFYLIFFFVVTKFRTKDKQVVYVITLIATVTYLFYPFFINREIMYLAIWWIGAEMARLYVRKESISFKNLRYPLIVLCVCSLLLIVNLKLNANNGLPKTIGVSPMLELRHFLFAIIAVVAAIIWNKMNWVLFSKTLGLFKPLASISFGIYISHYFLISEAHYLDFIQPTFVRYTLYFAICFLYAYIVERILYVYINNSIMKRLFKSNA